LRVQAPPQFCFAFSAAPARKKAPGEPAEAAGGAARRGWDGSRRSPRTQKNSPGRRAET